MKEYLVGLNKELQVFKMVKDKKAFRYNKLSYPLPYSVTHEILTHDFSVVLNQVRHYKGLRILLKDYFIEYNNPKSKKNLLVFYYKNTTLNGFFKTFLYNSDGKLVGCGHHTS